MTCAIWPQRSAWWWRSENKFQLDCEVREKVIARHFRPTYGFLFVLTLSFALSACGKSNGVVSNSSSTGGVSASPAPAQYAASPTPSVAAQSAASPTPNPVIKQAQAQPGVPVNVPESMKRPLTSEEMQKVMQQLPPEVRSRIMGMQKSPSPSPQPARK
jgi:hypothetical protein